MFFFTLIIHIHISIVHTTQIFREERMSFATTNLTAHWPLGIGARNRRARATSSSRNGSIGQRAQIGAWLGDARANREAQLEALTRGDHGLGIDLRDGWNFDVLTPFSSRADGKLESIADRACIFRGRVDGLP